LIATEEDINERREEKDPQTAKAEQEKRFPKSQRPFQYNSRSADTTSRKSDDVNGQSELSYFPLRWGRLTTKPTPHEHPD
jgi:hypothetical protein